MIFERQEKNSAQFAEYVTVPLAWSHPVNLMQFHLSAIGVQKASENPNALT